MKINVGKSIFFMRIEQICLGFILFGLWGNRIKTACLGFSLVFSPNITQLFTCSFKRIQYSTEFYKWE